MTRGIIAAGLLACALCACAQASEDTRTYEDGYDDGYEVAQGEGQAKIDELTEIIEKAKSEVADAQSAASEAEAAAVRVSREADSFGYQDWQDVVPAVQTAAANAQTAAQDLHSHLSDVETALGS